MNKRTDSLVDRLQQMIENSKDDIKLEFWDKKAILQENMSKEDRKKAQLTELKTQGVICPLHKHNIEKYEKN